MRLAAAARSAPAPEAQAQAAAAPHHTAGAGRLATTQAATDAGYILLADDDADMRAYLTRLLSEHWDVQVVADGAAALAAARARPPELILADVMMPGLDGFALLAALRDDPQTHALPVILLSARAGEEATVEGLQAGADDYLIKPFSARELLARVRGRLELARVRREAAARAAQLDAVFEAITDGVLIHDLDGRQMYANRAYRSLAQRQLALGRQPDDLERLLADPVEQQRSITISDEDGKTIPPEEWPTERALRGETLTGANAVEAYFRTPDGGALQMSVTAAPVHNADGKITGAAAVFRDVTARRLLERQVQEQATQLETIFEAQADGVAVFDLQGRILRTNRALSQLFGFDADTEYPSLPLAERVQRVQMFDEQGQRLDEAQWPHWRVLRGEILAGASAMDSRIQTLDGRELWVSTTGATIQNADGQATGIVLITRDVTARRLLERQVQEQATQLETVFDTMTDGVFVLDTEGRVTRINPAGQAFFGRASGDGVTRTAEDRARWLNLRDGAGQPIPYAQMPTVRLLRGDVLAGADAMTSRVRTREWQERTISLTGGPLRDTTGQIVGAVGVVRDVTDLQRTQAALAEQERLFRTLVENSPDIITRFDRNLRHLYVSPASEAVTGIRAEARLGKTYAEIGLPDALVGPWERTLVRVFATGQPYTFETTFHVIGQPLRHSQVRYIPEFAADGSVESVLGITTDITPLKHAEEALRHSEERFSKAFHASPVAMVITSAKTNRILDANAAEVRLTRYSRNELIGRTVSELRLIDPTELSHINTLSRWTTGVREIPVRVQTKAGDLRSCLVSTEAIWVGAEECLIVITYDVTARVEAEAALAEQERLFRTLVENSPDIIARFDRNQRYLYVNPAIGVVGDLASEAYIGKTNAELGWPESSYGPAQRAIEDVFRTGQSVMLEESDAASAGASEGRYFRAQILPEFGEAGAVDSVLSVTTEITDLKRAEEALRAATATAEAAQREEEQRRRDAERRERIAVSLRDVLTILNSNQHVAAILDHIARQAGRLLSSDAAAIYTTDADGASGKATEVWAAPAVGAAHDTLALQAAVGLPPSRMRAGGERRLAAGHAAIRRAMATRQPVAVMAPRVKVAQAAGLAERGAAVVVEAGLESESAEAQENCLPAREEPLPAPYQALLAVPIIAQGQVYGGLLLLYVAPRCFSPDAVSLAMAYSNQVALAIANARLQDHIERAAIETERTRLARELHDTVTQEIFTASVLAESIPRVWDQHRSEAEANLRQLHQLTRSALAALRALLLELRPAELEQKSLGDLLRQLGEAMTTRSGVPITLTIADDCAMLPNRVKVAFYRIAQESLMNTAKYAQARTISVRLRRLPAKQAYQLEIRDDGQGFKTAAVSAGHFGIRMMRERAQAVDAVLRITSRHEQGTHVTVKWAEESARPAASGVARS